MNKRLSIFTLTILLAALVIVWITRQFANPTFLVLITSVLAASTWLVYGFIQRTKPEDFIKNYLLTMVLKLLAGGIFIFVVLYLDKQGADANAVLFMAAYLVFTALEVGFLFKRLKR